MDFAGMPPEAGHTPKIPSLSHKRQYLPSFFQFLAVSRVTTNQLCYVECTVCVFLNADRL